MPMRTFIVTLSLLLVLWIAGASYWYVCRVRHDCKCCLEQTVMPTPVTPEMALKASIDEAKAFLTSAGKQSVLFAPSASTTDMNVLPADYITRLKFWLENSPDVKVKVTGHTDVTGSKAGNKKLSQARTDFVKDYLIKTGIKAEQIQATSKVDTEPVAPNTTKEGRAKNRRTEIEI